MNVPILMVIAAVCGARHVSSKMEDTAIHCQKKFLKCVRDKQKRFLQQQGPGLFREPAENELLEQCLADEKE